MLLFKIRNKRAETPVRQADKTRYAGLCLSRRIIIPVSEGIKEMIKAVCSVIYEFEDHKENQKGDNFHYLLLECVVFIGYCFTKRSRCMVPSFVVISRM